MKKLLFILCMSLLTLYGNAQIKKDKAGNYYSTPKTEIPAVATGKTFTDSKGTVYNIFVNSKGKYFINKVSKKTSKSYKQYLKLES